MQLGDPKFAVREAAQRELLKRGEGSVPELDNLAKGVDAETAERWGLVNQVVDDDQLADAARVLATRLAAGPPMAHEAIKRLLNAQAVPALRAQLDLEADAQAAQGESDEFAEGVAAFAQKRAPRFAAPVEV